MILSYSRNQLFSFMAVGVQVQTFGKLPSFLFTSRTDARHRILFQQINIFIYTKFQHSKYFTTKSFSSSGHATNVSQL